jgi:hypothetical protein
MRSDPSGMLRDMKREGVSAAEMYAELEASGKERPQCECHGESMYWQRHTRSISGGGWRCPAKQREYAQRWRKSNPERYREMSRRGLRRLRYGIHEDTPIMSLSERQALSAKTRVIRRAVANQHTMNVIEKLDGKRAQLMRLAVNEGASPFERRKALEQLDKHNARSVRKDSVCQPSRTTSVETQTPRLLPRSTSF